MPLPIVCPNEDCPESKKERSEHVVKNYSMMWHDGDIHCAVCDTYIRMYDAG